MNISQIGELLAEIHILDNRRVDEATLTVWHRLLDDVDFDEAVAAVRLHFRDPALADDYLTPARVRRSIDRIRRAALGPMRDEFDNDIEPDHLAIAAFERLHTEQKAITS